MLNQLVGKARAAVTQDRIEKWFDEILHYLKEQKLDNILQDPTRIFNGDEAGYQLCPKSGKVLGPTKLTEDFYERVSCDKEQITVMATFTADGKVVPPMLIFPYKKMPKVIVESVPANWGLGRSDSGWINSEVFFEYISNHFLPYLKSENIIRPIILFVDGHRSHLTQEVSRFCDDHGIILISLFPNTTHIMQPADVSVFKPLKAGWQSAVRSWKFQNFPKEVTRHTFGSILKFVFEEYATAKTIQNGFRKSGLYPFNKNNVDYSKCIPNRKLTNDSNTSEQNGNNFEKRVLEAVEKRIEKEELDQFIKTYERQREWEGNIESVNLYKVWSSIKMNVNDNSQQDQISRNDDTLSYFSNSEAPRQDEDTIPQLCMTETSNNSVNVDIQKDLETQSEALALSPLPHTSTETYWTTPDNVATRCYSEKENEGYKIPTPFKKCLIFPKTPPKQTPKRKRVIFPAVVSSGKYRQYYENEAQKKSTPKGKNKKESPNDSSSESEIDVRYNDEDLDLSENEELDLRVGKYVIIRYQDNYFAGVILKNDSEGAEVRSMMSAGVGSWKWPMKDDILYYFKNDIICIINGPEVKNKRGHYSVPEMLKYE